MKNESKSINNNPELERVERNPFASKSLYKTFKKSFIKNASRKNASLIECLESLYQITYPNYDVIVVDNGSEDDSVKRYLYKKMTNFNLVIK